LLRPGLYLEGSEPHEPVEPVVVGGDEAGASGQVPWLTQELVLLPHSLWVLRVLIHSTLQNHLSPLLSDTAQRGRDPKKVVREEKLKKDGRE
jgi:hypothetical protein